MLTIKVQAFYTRNDIREMTLKAFDDSIGLMDLATFIRQEYKNGLKEISVQFEKGIA